MDAKEGMVSLSRVLKVTVSCNRKGAQNIAVFSERKVCAFLFLFYVAFIILLCADSFVHASCHEHRWRDHPLLFAALVYWHGNIFAVGHGSSTSN